MPVRKLSKKMSKRSMKSMKSMKSKKSMKSMKSMKNKKHTRRVHKHRGGSLASDRVMSFANDCGVEIDAPVAPRLSANPANLNLYQTTGGARRRLKKRNSKSKSRSNSKSKSMRMKRGGGATDFRDTLYSRTVDGRSDEVPFFNAFTSEEYLSPQQLINEPNTVANPPFATYPTHNPL
jgi:hypothetical protein